MTRIAITTSALGYAKTALDVKKAAEKKHKENRQKAFKSVRKNFKGLGSSAWEELKSELKNPWNLVPPIAILKIGLIWPIKGFGAVLGFAINTPIDLLNARRESLKMKKSAVRIVGYAVLEEMQRDKALKDKISDLVNKQGLKWLYVDGSGQIVLTDSAGYSKSITDKKKSFPHNPKFLAMPRVDMEDILSKTNLTFVEADKAPAKTFVALRGNEVQVSEAGKKEIEYLRRENLLKLKITKSAKAGKLTLQFYMKGGVIRKFTIDAEEAKKIFKRMKK